MEPLAVSMLRYEANPAALPLAGVDHGEEQGIGRLTGPAQPAAEVRVRRERPVRHVGPVDPARVGGEGVEQGTAVRILAQRLQLAILSPSDGAVGSRRRLPAGNRHSDRLAELVAPRGGAGNPPKCLTRPVGLQDVASLGVSLRLHAEI